MRIALIAPPWAPVPPPRYGGTELVVDLLARGYAAAGHDVTLFTTGDSTCPVSRDWVFERAEWSRLGALDVELRHTLHAYDSIAGFDVVHDNTLAGPLLSTRPRAMPVVVTAHGDFASDLHDVYRAMGRVGRLVAISHAQVASAPDINVARVIHHGVDTAALPFGAGDGGYLLFLGRMSPDKGVHRAVAVARAAGVPLRIAAKLAEPAEWAYFKDKIEPELSSDIEYVGEVAPPEKASLLRGARALLFPIQWPEPFGLVMAEALSSGTPVLAFRAGSAAEVVEDGVTGFLCADDAAMVAAVGQLDSIARLECRRAAEEYFCAERMVDEYLLLFEQLTAERRDDRSGRLTHA